MDDPRYRKAPLAARVATLPRPATPKRTEKQELHEQPMRGLRPNGYWLRRRPRPANSRGEAFWFSQVRKPPPCRSRRSCGVRGSGHRLPHIIGVGGRNAGIEQVFVGLHQLPSPVRDLTRFAVSGAVLPNGRDPPKSTTWAGSQRETRKAM